MLKTRDKEGRDPACLPLKKKNVPNNYTIYSKQVEHKHRTTKHYTDYTGSIVPESLSSC